MKTRLGSTGRKTMLAVALATCQTTAFALPSLQLGSDPTDTSTWSYDSASDTWVASGSSSFSLFAYANCDSGASGCNSPNGDFAWDSSGASDRYAYLVLASSPDIGNVDAFDVTVSGATLVDSGWGNPPLQDTNSISPHGVYDTYFEIYEFQFDGPIGTIHDVQPGETGSGDGYTESFDIIVNSLLDGVDGIHFDLFTVSGERWDTTDLTPNRHLVEAVAPYSHDAEWTSTVAEPGTLALMGIGLAGVAGLRRRKA